MRCCACADAWKVRTTDPGKCEDLKVRTAPNMKIKRRVALAVQALTTFIVFIALGGGVVLQLWNWLLPPLFGVPEVTFWQALGILALCRILFGGFGDPTRDRSGWRRRTAEPWQRLSPDEQERLRQGAAGPVSSGAASQGE